MSWLVIFASPSVQILGEFMVMLLLFSIGASSFVDTAWIWGNWSSAPRDAGPAPTIWTDRIVAAVIGWSDARRVAALRSEPQPAITFET